MAKASAYSDDDAVLLAWADEETDYTLQVKAWNCLWSNLGLYFHFWPDDNKDLICRVDSELSRRIMDYVARFYMSPGNLTRFGIALHGLQDTYFHQGWVGKFSRHNVLPAWANDKFTPSLPFPYGHSPKGKEPDIANATWYDPRTNNRIINLERIEEAIEATARALGGHSLISLDDILAIFRRVQDYEARKQNLRDLAGMPELRFSEIRKDMVRRYGKKFRAAANEQARIVKEYLR